MDRLPIVAIVGRQNVGKSSLLNAIAGRRLSIVDPMPGVTRDRLSAIVQVRGVPFELVDTAGIGLAREDEFFASVERQINFAIKQADLILFVVDAIAGPTSGDGEIAKRLKNADKPVMLIANKCDNQQIETGLSAFGELGFGLPIPVSCAHMRKVGDLLSDVLEKLPESDAAAFSAIKVAIVGQRNVGKSTLVNSLFGEERVIVSDVPGTTRDAVDVHVKLGKQDFILIDTAGLRKKKNIENSVELFSRVRTEEAIGRADVIVFMMDVTQKISEIDRRIGGVIEERKRPAVIVLNKWDLVPKEKFGPDVFAKYIVKAMPPLNYVPVLFISALKGERASKVLEVARELHHQAGTKIPTSEVNKVCELAQKERSPGTRGIKMPKIFYATQVRANPPSFVVFVNDPKNFTPDYVRFLERKFREYLPFPEVPIRLSLKARKKKGPR